MSVTENTTKTTVTVTLTWSDDYSLHTAIRHLNEAIAKSMGGQHWLCERLNDIEAEIDDIETTVD